MPSAIAVFSGKSKDRILREGGTQSWRLVPANAAAHEFVVCCRSGVDWVEGNEPRGSAFLVGRIAGVSPATSDPGRYLIRISEYAETEIPGVWKGWRNPVRYTSLEDLGIDVAKLKFKPMPAQPKEVEHSQEEPSVPQKLGLSIAEAKTALSRHYGVPTESIEITIRG